MTDTCCPCLHNGTPLVSLDDTGHCVRCGQFVARQVVGRDIRLLDLGGKDIRLLTNDDLNKANQKLWVE